MSSQKNKAPYWRQISPEGYLVNLSDGSTEWYHVTDRTECTFEPDRVAYLCADKQYLLGETNAIFNDEQRESGRARICKVRVRGLKWSDVFDIADYLEPGGGEDSVVNARGRALEEKYTCDISNSYHYMGFEETYSCRPLMMGFRAWLEDEGDYWPENPSGYWPETLVVETGDGVEIEVVGEESIERGLGTWRLVERENPECTESLKMNDYRQNPEEYTLIYESELDDFDEFEDFYEVDPETVDPWAVTRAVNLGVSNRKEFHAGHLFNGQLVSALFVAPAYADCFSFDVAVLPEYQSRGLGKELVDTAIEAFEMYEYSKDGDFEYCVQVVNPHMKNLLERKGFFVVESTSAENEWIMERARQNPQVLPTKASNGRYDFTLQGNLEDPSDWEVISGYPFTRAGYWDLTVWYSSGSPYFSLDGASYESDAFLKALPLIVDSYPSLLDWHIRTGSGYDPTISDLLQKAVDIPIHRKTYLHGTSEAALEKIEQMGLLPPSVSGAEPAYGAQISSAKPADPRATYLTTDFATASWASRDAANKARSSRVILEVLPPFTHTLFGPDVDSGVSSAEQSLETTGAVAYFGEIPPEQIRLHAYFDSDLDEWVLKERDNPESLKMNDYRQNPDEAWYSTQSLRNDEEGYLINPDTGGVRWYHGSKHGTLAYGGDVIYLTSDIDTAYAFACIDRPIFQDADWEASVYKMKIKISARNIFDVRQYAEDPRVERLADVLGVWTYAGDKDQLIYHNYDVGLGYSGGKHRGTATDLGFKGWLETEHDKFGLGIPCSIGLFTDLGQDSYEIVDESSFDTDECLRIELASEPDI